MYINIPCKRHTAALHALLYGLPRISKITVTRNSIARSVIMKLAHFGAKASSTWRYMTWRYDVYLSARTNPTVITSDTEKEYEGSSAVYLSVVITWSEKLML